MSVGLQAIAKYLKYFACLGSRHRYKPRIGREGKLKSQTAEGDDPKVFEAKIQRGVIFTWVLSFVDKKRV